MNDRKTSVKLNRGELQKLKSQAMYGRTYSGRISVALAFRLLDTSDPYFNCFSVLDELDHLEGIRPSSRTKPEQQFQRKPLHPFWHKHFFLAKHVPQNVGVRWNLHDGGNRDLKKMLNEVADKFGEDIEQWPNHLTHRLVVQGFKERAERGLTGDWIIFAKHEGKNFYLDLATHEEGKDDNADALIQKLRNGSFAEFPFLFD